MNKVSRKNLFIYIKCFNSLGKRGNKIFNIESVLIKINFEMDFLDSMSAFKFSVTLVVFHSPDLLLGY
jgi:hypothetical protein